MATTPTTSALGAVADISRPASTGRAAPAATDDGSPNKSSFSTVLEGARDSAREPAARSKPAATEVAEGDAPQKSELDKQLLLARKTMKPNAGSGNELPPDGDILPANAELSLLISSATTSAPASKSPLKSAEGDDSTATATPTPVDLTATQPVPTPFVPENAATSAAGLVPRASGAAAGDGDAANPLTDAMTSPKREVPTPPQALTAAAVSVESKSDVVSVETADAAVASPAPAAVAVNADVSETATTAAPVIAADADAAPTADTLLARLTGKARATTTAAPATDALGTQATETPGEGVPKAGAMALAEVKSVGNSERAEFRDVMKQVDTTVVTTAAAPERNDSAAATRDTGLRQYIDASATTTARVDVPVGKPGWSNAVSDKVMWMSAQNINSAEIQLNPPELGPLSVRVSSHHDQTSIYFTSNHAAVRDALDQSLPRLREMLDGQGIRLVDVGVGDQSGARQQTPRGENFTNSGRRGETDDLDSIGEISSVSARSRAATQHTGLLDAYA